MSNLPKGWELKRIGSFANIVTGNTPPTKDIENFGNEYPWITPTDIKSRKDIFSSERKLSEKGYSISRQLPKNTVLITSIASIGKNAILRENGSCNQQINAILPSENHNTDFIYYWFEKNTDYIKSLAGQTAVPILNKKDFSNIIIPLPPLEEQKKIADILSIVDKKIAFVEENINATEELKKGLMQKLLTEGIGHTEFKETKIGKLPILWSMKELNDISDITRLAGYEYSEYWNESETGDIIALKGYNIGKGKIVNKNLFYISNELSNQLNRSKLYSGDVVFPCVGTIGNAVSINENNTYHINQNIAKITPKLNLDSNYLVQYLMSTLCKREIFKFNATTSQPNVLVGSLRKFRVPVPPVEEQKQIAEILSTVDNKLENLKEKKQSFEELKKGLMQKLLTGEVRV